MFYAIKIKSSSISRRCSYPKNGSDMTTLTITNEEINDIMKIVHHKCLEDAGLLIEGVSETIKNEAKCCKVH